jgi:Flp pilus assembly pilin Flp
MNRPAREHREHHELGASAVEYGLLAAAVTGSLLIGAIALQAASGAIFDQAVTSVERTDTAP